MCTPVRTTVCTRLSKHQKVNTVGAIKRQSDGLHFCTAAVELLCKLPPYRATPPHTGVYNHVHINISDIFLELDLQEAKNRLKMFVVEQMRRIENN